MLLTDSTKTTNKPFQTAISILVHVRYLGEKNVTIRLAVLLYLFWNDSCLGSIISLDCNTCFTSTYNVPISYLSLERIDWIVFLSMHHFAVGPRRKPETNHLHLFYCRRLICIMFKGVYCTIFWTKYDKKTFTESDYVKAVFNYFY